MLSAALGVPPGWGPPCAAAGAGSLADTGGWECSCMLAPAPVRHCPLKHSGCNAFLSPSKAFSRRNSANYTVVISMASSGEREALVLLYRHAGEEQVAGLALCKVVTDVSSWKQS